MKKILLAVLTVLIFTSGAMAQYKTKKLIIPIVNRASTFGVPVNIGDFVYIEADSAMYMSKVKLGPNATGTYLTADASRYAVAKIATGRNALTATTLDASGATTLSTTLAVTGNVAVNTNKFNVTAASGNTTVAGTLGVTGATTLTGDATLSGNLTGNILIRDSVAFTTTATRVAKAVVGATAASVYVVTPKAKASSGSTGRPVAGDVCNAYAKADSVVFMRQAGTTSGLVVYFIRIK